MNYLLDTNVISEIVSLKPSVKILKWFDVIPSNALYLSVLSLGEIRKGVEKVKLVNRKEELRHWLEHELTEWFRDRLLPIDQAVADKWGWLQSQLSRTMPAIDSLLAATALHYDLCIVTRNVQDFDCPFLEVINPWN